MSLALNDMEMIENDDDIVRHPLREGLRNTGICISGAGAVGTILWLCLKALYEEKNFRVLLGIGYRAAFLVMGGVFAFILGVFLAHSYLGMFIGRRRATQFFRVGIATVVLVGLSFLVIVTNVRR